MRNEGQIDFLTTAHKVRNVYRHTGREAEIPQSLLRTRFAGRERPGPRFPASKSGRRTPHHTVLTHSHAAQDIRVHSGTQRDTCFSRPFQAGSLWCYHLAPTLPSWRGPCIAYFPLRINGFQKKKWRQTRKSNHINVNRQPVRVVQNKARLSAAVAWMDYNVRPPVA